MIELKQVSYTYPHSEKFAVRDFSAVAAPGQLVALIGPNGCGKSTLMRLIYGLVRPATGLITVAGLDVSCPDQKPTARRRMGLVLQNPEYQYVAAQVEEDVAFGPENLNLPGPEIRARVESALRTVRLTHLKQKPPHLLSGGEKQKLALAGVLALKPDYLVLDEPTSMLDPIGRRELMDVVLRLARDGLAVIMVTHHMEEAALADLVWVMADGELVLQGTPAHVFNQTDLIHRLGLELPFSAALSKGLAHRGLKPPRGICTMEDLVVYVCTALR